MIPSAARIAARANHPILSNWLKLTTSPPAPVAIIKYDRPVVVATAVENFRLLKALEKFKPTAKRQDERGHKRNTSAVQKAWPILAIL